MNSPKLYDLYHKGEDFACKELEIYKAHNGNHYRNFTDWERRIQRTDKSDIVTAC